MIDKRTVARINEAKKWRAIVSAYCELYTYSFELFEARTRRSFLDRSIINNRDQCESSNFINWYSLLINCADLDLNFTKTSTLQVLQIGLSEISTSLSKQMRNMEEMISKILPRMLKEKLLKR